MTKKDLQLELQFIKKVYLVKKDLHSHRIILFRLFYVKDNCLKPIFIDKSDNCPFEVRENNVYKVIDLYNTSPTGIIDLFSDWLYGVKNRFEIELL